MCAAPPPSPSDDFAAVRLAMLRELAEVGMAVARAIGRQAQAVGGAVVTQDAETDAAPAPAVGDLGLAFSRVSRAVRLTLALEARTSDETFGPARAAAKAAQEAVDRAATSRNIAVFCKADDLGEVMQDMIEDAAGEDEDKAERLCERLCERLDDLEPDEVFERPFEELLARICKDLAIEPDLSLWEHEAWVEKAGGLRAVKRAFARVAAEASPTEGAVLQAQPP